MDKDALIDQVFFKKLTDVLENNYSNELFGVKELAKSIGMSRSQLHRKINSTNGKSTSQYIREFRLKKALKMLQDDVVTASEISYQVGFNSPTYFNTCFHKYYGYPPGEVKYKTSIDTHTSKEKESIKPIDKNGNEIEIKDNSSKNRLIVLSTVLVLIIVSLSYYFYTSSTIKNNIIGSKEKKVEKSIAVLPFKNLSDNKENQYFADGVMDDILNHLSAIKGFKVISRTTMEQYRKSNKTAPEIAKELRVNYIIESSIQKYNDSIKIISQLIDAKKDKHIWSKNFKGEFKNIFALESAIAKQIAEGLEATLTPDELKQIDKVPTENIEAYNLYLKGRYFFNILSVENFKKSISYFEQSIIKDPKFALAYASLAEVYLYLADSEKIDLRKIEKLALKAIELDSNIAEAHSVLGALACWYDWDWDKAEKEYKLAIKINPNSSNAYINYSFFRFFVKGDSKNAREMIDIAKNLDPLSSNAIMRSAEFYLNEGDFENTMLETQKVLEIDQSSTWAYWVNFECYFRQSKNEKALSELVKSWELNSVSTANIKPMKAAYDKDGIDGIYQWIIDYDQSEGDNSDGRLGIGWNNFQLYWIAQKYAFLNKKKEAIKFLEIAYDRKSTMIYHIKYDPYFKNLRFEPKFLEILEKMNLGDYSNEQVLKP